MAEEGEDVEVDEDAGRDVPKDSIKIETGKAAPLEWLEESLFQVTAANTFQNIRRGDKLKVKSITLGEDQKESKLEDIRKRLSEPAAEGGYTINFWFQDLVLRVFCPGAPGLTPAFPPDCKVKLPKEETGKADDAGEAGEGEEGEGEGMEFNCHKVILCSASNYFFEKFVVKAGDDGSGGEEGGEVEMPPLPNDPEVGKI